METEGPNKEQKRLRTSVHVCPRCGFPIDLKELGLGGGTTGLVTCPKCDWSGPISIGTIAKEPAD